VTPGTDHDAAIARTGMALVCLALLSRVLGLARDMATAWLLGAGPVADALTAALRIPHMARRFLGDGSLAMPLTAAMVRTAHPQGPCAVPAPDAPEPFRCTFAGLALRCLVVLLCLVLAGEFAAPWIIHCLAPGFAVSVADLAASLLRICLPYVAMAGMAAMCMAYLNSRNRFLLPALSPTLFNIAMLAALALAWHSVPAGGDSAVPGVAMWVAAGMACSGIVQLLWQWSGVGRPSGILLVAPEGGRRFAASMTRGIVSACSAQLAMLAAMAVASFQEGVACLYYAERLIELPLGLAGVCLATAGLPTLSRLAVREEFPAFAGVLATSLRWSLFYSLPACIGLLAVSPTLIPLLLKHGAFNDAAVRGTILAVFGYLPGLPAFALNRCLMAACHATGGFRAAARSAGWTVVATVAAGIALSWCLPPMLRTMAPSLGASVGLWLQFLLLRHAVIRALPSTLDVGLLSPGTIVCAGIAAVATGTAAWAAVILCGGLGDGPVTAIAFVAGLGACLGCLALGAPRDMRLLLDGIGRRGAAGDRTEGDSEQI
jgi:putative peptidoglycan lipid II flippase